MAKTNKTPQSAKKTETTTKVVLSIVEQSNNRSRADIRTWRNALNSAENKILPRRLALYNLHDELILDNHISSLMWRRINHVTGRPFVITDKKTGDISREITDLFKKNWFYDVRKYAIEYEAHGHSLLEFTEITLNNITVELVPRRHVHPEFGAFTINQTDTNYIVYRNNPAFKTLLEIGGKNNLGFLTKAAPNILFKKNATIAWSEYCEIFGMPMRVGKTQSRSTTDLDRMEDALINMGKASYAVINDGETIEFIESTRGDSFNVYDRLIERCNSELSKLVLQETMTTDVGKSSGYAQAKIHEGVSDKVEDADQMFIQALVVEKIFPLLTANGINCEGLNFEFTKERKIDNDTFEQDKWLFDNFEIDPEYFKQKYAAPIKGLKQAVATPTITVEKKTNPTNKTNPTMAMHEAIHNLYNTNCNHTHGKVE